MRFFLPLFLLLISCSQLPRLALPESSRVSEIQKQCRELFPDRNMRLVHSIEAHIPGRGTQFMTGLTLLSPERKWFRSVMMSIEGLVFFDGVYDKGEIRIARGIPPFDSPNFARGLLHDVRLMVLRPEGRCAETGVLTDGIPVCRYGDDTETIDVEIPREGERLICQYISGRLRRTVRVRPGSGTAISEETDLRFHGAVGYALHLRLLESEGISEDDFQEMMKVEM